ncbi:MAG TPA: hypothetical protein VFE45_03365 [Coriobacteriia bacterium]|nr:hypothetical protein [Coriobacteriia bacterium]
MALRMFVALRQRTSLQKIRKAVAYLAEQHPETHMSAHKLKATPSGGTIVWIAEDGRDPPNGGSRLRTERVRTKKQSRAGAA